MVRTKNDLPMLLVFIALAPGMRDDIMADGISGDKISVIPNGCDLDVFFPDFYRSRHLVTSMTGWEIEN